jgi:hypothetical protein
MRFQRLDPAANFGYQFVNRLGYMARTSHFTFRGVVTVSRISRSNQLVAEDFGNHFVIPAFEIGRKRVKGLVGSEEFFG